MADLNRAQALQREAALFRIVRPGLSAQVERPLAPRPVAAPSSPGPALATAMFQAPVSPTPSSNEELGERFLALADTDNDSDGVDESERLNDVLARLRAEAPLPEQALIWPTLGLSSLAAVDRAAAGRWLVCLGPVLHRVDPDLRFDLIVRGVGCLALTSHGDVTEAEWRESGRSRRDRDLFARGSTANLAGATLADRTRGVKGKEGLNLLKQLSLAPVSLSDLETTPGAVIDPLAFWRLVGVSIPAVTGDLGARIVHRDPARPGLSATVTFEPGRPLRVEAGEGSDADAVIETHATDLLSWALEGDRSGAGSALLDSGSGEAEAVALRQIGRGFSPIRARS
ncbi:MAG: hypothetical protein F2799_08455 [Actinobacteria bacterium]|uniref:Unannotated protein n=1 Tax=freshwater metagenome TaxID=449393 RepID=A0A6J7ERB9_9ZZZZ|nr:hypothetical protein [Actinomycetota bacterium]